MSERILAIQQYAATIDYIVDGDTLHAYLHLFPNLIFDEDIRLADIDAPEHETWTVQGLVDPALNYCQQKLPVGAVVVIDVRREEKYGRYLGVIHYKLGSVDPNDIMMNGTIINDELVTLGYAKHYEGGKK